MSLSKPISPAVQRKLDERPNLCQRRLVFRDHECQGRITQEHALYYAGSRIDHECAIIKLCAWAHDVDEFQDGHNLDKAKNEYIALAQATQEFFDLYPRGNWQQRRGYLTTRFAAALAVLVLLIMPATGHAQTNAMLTILTNASRSGYNLPALTETPALDTRAQARAEELCRTGQWSHAGWLTSFSGMPSGWYGENLAKDFPNDVAAHLALLASPTHRANIMNPHYSQIGVGTACGIEVELFAGYN